MVLEAIEGITQVFKVKMEKLIQDFKGGKIGSDDLVLNIKQTRINKKFKNEFESKGEWNTPFVPGGKTKRG
jgi:hypothetical protein